MPSQFLLLGTDSPGMPPSFVPGTCFCPLASLGGDEVSAFLVLKFKGKLRRSAYSQQSNTTAFRYLPVPDYDLRHAGEAFQLAVP